MTDTGEDDSRFSDIVGQEFGPDHQVEEIRPYDLAGIILQDTENVPAELFDEVIASHAQRYREYDSTTPRIAPGETGGPTLDMTDLIEFDKSKATELAKGNVLYMAMLGIAKIKNPAEREKKMDKLYQYFPELVSNEDPDKIL